MSWSTVPLVAPLTMPRVGSCAQPSPRAKPRGGTPAGLCSPAPSRGGGFSEPFWSPSSRRGQHGPGPALHPRLGRDGVVGFCFERRPRVGGRESVLLVQALPPPPSHLSRAFVEVLREVPAAVPCAEHGQGETPFFLKDIMVSLTCVKPFKYGAPPSPLVSRFPRGGS